MKRLSSTVLWLALALSPPVAIAGSMKCGGTYIEDGQLVPVTAAQVLAACGQPTSKEFGQWVYQQEGEFTKILTFDAQGNLRSISDQPASD